MYQTLSSEHNIITQLITNLIECANFEKVYKISENPNPLLIKMKLLFFFVFIVLAKNTYAIGFSFGGLVSSAVNYAKKTLKSVAKSLLDTLKDYVSQELLGKFNNQNQDNETIPVSQC